MMNTDAAGRSADRLLQRRGDCPNLETSMPKTITSEMVHAMSLDQRKTLYQNALGRDTPAAHAVLEILSQDDMMSRPKPAAAPGKSGKVAAPRKAKAAQDRKPIKAVHGRQT